MVRKPEGNLQQGIQVVGFLKQYLKKKKIKYSKNEHLSDRNAKEMEHTLQTCLNAWKWEESSEEEPK